mgnify:CR=1 FL=1
MTGDYFQEVSKALKEFHEWNTTPQLKPLYMLIKVEVDKDIVQNQDKAEAYVRAKQVWRIVVALPDLPCTAADDMNTPPKYRCSLTTA